MKNELTAEQQSIVDLDAAADVITLAVLSLLRWLAARPDFTADDQRVGKFYALKVTPCEQDRGVFVATSHSMRAIVSALGGRHGFERATYIVSVPAESPGKRARQEPVVGATWPLAQILMLLESTSAALFAKHHTVQFSESEWKTEAIVTIDAREASHVPDADLSDALSRVFGAIARARGRKLFVELRRGGAA